MSKPVLQFLFKSHGRGDVDLQDLEFDKCFGAFFRPGSFNVLGMENAGEFTDADRDAALEAVIQDPSNTLLQSIRAAGVPATGETRAFYEMCQLAHSLSQKDAIMLREWLLLDEWNRAHSDCQVFPFVESFPTEEIRAEIERRSDACTDPRQIFGGELWKEVYQWFVAIARESTESYATRNRNWIRQLDQLIATRTSSNDLPLRIMVVMGSLHTPLSTLARERWPVDVDILPDIVLPPEDRPSGDDHALAVTITHGTAPSEADVIHAITFESLLRKTANAPTGEFYSRDRSAELELWLMVRRAPFRVLLEFMTFERSAWRAWVRRLRGHKRKVLTVSVPPDLRDRLLVNRSEGDHDLANDVRLVVAALCAFFSLPVADRVTWELLEEVVTEMGPGPIRDLRSRLVVQWAKRRIHLDGLLVQRIARGNFGKKRSGAHEKAARATLIDLAGRALTMSRAANER